MIRLLTLQWFLFYHCHPSLSFSLFFYFPLTVVRDPEDPGLVSIHKALLIYSDPPSLSPLSLQLAGCLQTAGGEKGLEGTSTGVGGGGVLVREREVGGGSEKRIQEVLHFLPGQAWEGGRD